jgi:hypothetical protein
MPFINQVVFIIEYLEVIAILKIKSHPLMLNEHFYGVQVLQTLSGVVLPLRYNII